MGRFVNEKKKAGIVLDGLAFLPCTIYALGVQRMSYKEKEKWSKLYYRQGCLEHRQRHRSNRAKSGRFKAANRVPLY